MVEPLVNPFRLSRLWRKRSNCSQGDPFFVPATRANASHSIWVVELVVIRGHGCYQQAGEQKCRRNHCLLRLQLQRPVGCGGNVAVLAFGQARLSFVEGLRRACARGELLREPCQLSPAKRAESDQNDHKYTEIINI
jgi:hypothetical protein